MEKRASVLARLHNTGIIARTDVMGRDYTSFRIGGLLGVFAEPRNSEELDILLKAAEQEEYPAYVMGNGSNMLIPDRGIDALFIRIGDKMAGYSFCGNTLCAQAGALLSTIAKASVRAGLTGLEWAAGIPGTLGGGVAMNAGAYGGEMKQTLTSVTVYRNGRVEKLAVSDGDMGYRRSRYVYPDMITLGATLQLLPDDGVAQSRIDEYAKRRREKQPINMPSAGSTFKRPEGFFAGALIEGAGLKGRAVGGAMVSEKHAGFIVNTGGATYDNVINLIDIVRTQVYKKYGVMLETEVKILG